MKPMPSRLSAILVLSTSLSSAYTLLPQSISSARRAGRIAESSAPLLQALPTPEESAQALTDYMAKAHEEKIRAVAAAEAKSKDRIKELEIEVADLKEQLASQSIPTEGAHRDGSYEFPATNKALAEKVRSYQAFVKDYVVKAQMQKMEAVAAAERKVRAECEEKMRRLMGGA
uniref:Uncharacterized protein n=1 Tax=Trieres chinensis TaxID=1514140 RepID=A0A7S1YSW1_TRICV